LDSIYLGKVITIDDEENEAKINFMEQCTGKIAGIYRWPNPPYELWVSLSDILKRIPEPLPNGRSKRMFNIPETESVAIESKFGDWKTFQN
jgi:hypothetical protein